MFGLLGAAFGIGKSLAGLNAPKLEREVANAENALNTRIADITARRVQRDNASLLSRQMVQNAALGNSQYGSALLVAADDTRRARERVTNVYLNNATRIAGNNANLPTQAGATSQALGSIFSFGKALYSLRG